MKPSRTVAGLVCMVLLALFTGCADAATNPAFTDACRAMGLCDEPVPPPAAVELLCDASSGASCSRETLGSALDVVLAFAAGRPGSRVRVWILGRDVATTEAVAELVVPPVGRGGERSRRAAREHFATSARSHFLAASAHAFQGPPTRRSPIAEAASKVALAEADGLPRTMIAITDGREVSGLGDFECARLPSDATFLATLRWNHVLGAGLFRDVAVQLVFVEAAPVVARRCAVSVDREIRVRALWTAAFKAAGAVDVRVTSGPPVFTSHESPLQEGASR